MGSVLFWRERSQTVGTARARRCRRRHERVVGGPARAQPPIRSRPRRRRLPSSASARRSRSSACRCCTAAVVAAVLVAGLAGGVRRSRRLHHRHGAHTPLRRHSLGGADRHSRKSGRRLGSGRGARLPADLAVAAARGRHSPGGFGGGGFRRRVRWRRSPAPARSPAADSVAAVSASRVAPAAAASAADRSSTRARRARRSSSCSRPTPATTAGLVPQSTLTQRPDTSLRPTIPIMAIGGFNGTDPAPTLAQFEQYVAQGRIHYFLGSGGGFGGGGSGDSRARSRSGSSSTSPRRGSTV